MRTSTSYQRSIAFLCLSLFLIASISAQTKRIKRPKKPTGISTVDNFVSESFDLYDKVYKYDTYAQTGKSLEDEDIDVLEDALQDVTALSENAVDILDALEGQSLLKQGKATLQINRAKKALKYSVKTSKELLLGARSGNQKEDESSSSENSNSDSSDNTTSKDTSTSDNSTTPKPPSNISDGLEIYSKYDFVPGDKLLFFDDFSQDFVGDFPSKWNTNGTGEVVKVNNVEGKWFELKAGYSLNYIPLLSSKLPEDYTIEFDLLAVGLDNQTSSTARIMISLEDNDTFKRGNNTAVAELPLGQFGAFNTRVSNRIDNTVIINSALKTDIRKAVLNKPHIAIAVNKRRYRLWINEKKYIDIPQLVAPGAVIKTVKFSLYGLNDGKERIFIQNIKIAEGGVDLRRKLMADGKISTNGILFDSGSANIQPQSLGIVRQISQVLMQDDSIRLNIIGHTDSDGKDNANLKLSKARADAVKTALTDIYNIAEDRLTTEGKGESEPIGDNTTADGKAQNRRVEFVKI